MKKDILKSKRKHGGKLIWHRLFLLVCFAVLSFLYILPLALEGTLILGEDTRFHLNRIIWYFLSGIYTLSVRVFYFTSQR